MVILDLLLTRAHADFWLSQSMLPIVGRTLFEKKTTKAMHTYTAFFNTEPQLVPWLRDYSRVRKKHANGADGVDDEQSMDSVLVWWGPVAGIGDSLIVGDPWSRLSGDSPWFGQMEIPLVLSSISLSELTAYFGIPAHFKGYWIKDKALNFLYPQGQAIRKSVSIIGGMVIGGSKCQFKFAC